MGNKKFTNLAPIIGAFVLANIQKESNKNKQIPPPLPSILSYYYIINGKGYFIYGFYFFDYQWKFKIIYIREDRDNSPIWNVDYDILVKLQKQSNSIEIIKPVFDSLLTFSVLGDGKVSSEEIIGTVIYQNIVNNNQVYTLPQSPLKYLPNLFESIQKKVSDLFLFKKKASVLNSLVIPGSPQIENSFKTPLIKQNVEADIKLNANENKFYKCYGYIKSFKGKILFIAQFIKIKDQFYRINGFSKLETKVIDENKNYGEAVFKGALVNLLYKKGFDNDDNQSDEESLLKGGFAGIVNEESIQDQILEINSSILHNLILIEDLILPEGI